MSSQPTTKNTATAYQVTALALMAMVIGVLTSTVATGFVAAVQWLNDYLYISPISRVKLYYSVLLSSVVTITVTTLGGLLTGLLLHYLSNEKRPLGPPDTILAVQLNKELPDTRSGVVSTLASIISLGCGASVGQYGPLVYLGALVGNIIRKCQITSDDTRNIMIACGVAAAISSAFSAPIAGLVFAHEVILRHFSMRAFAPTTIASAASYIFSDFTFDIEPLFLVDFVGVEHGVEFLLFVLLGLFSACLALIFISSLLHGQKWAKSIPLPLFIKPALAGLILGCCALLVPEILGIGTETMRFATIEGAFSLPELLSIMLMKLVVTVLCISFGFVGGVFSPLLLIGILFGAFNWMLINDVFELINSGITVYAICGMMAVTSPVIGAPLTCILIVFELTRNYELTIAAMVSVVFSNLLVAKVYGRSLFDSQLLSRGFNLAEGRDQAILQTTTVQDVMRNDFPIACIDESLTNIFNRLDSSPWSEVYIIENNGKFLGTLRPTATSSAHLKDCLHSPRLLFSTSTTLWQAMESLEGFVGDAVPIVDDEGKLIAVVTEADVISAYMRVVHMIQKEERASS
ncbi:chloride channel protein [Veronia pacifica]|uniref:CBS domain-containing protein n=1 Tax=Veronia pacifica TaxID=1080227 RepID=A0A1C3EQR6_9GAMM|nr:chloride channel protein [Veronia pacifica]ODA35594.1 hypothetical protein A8L45_02925 [Veronia pacifica]